MLSSDCGRAKISTSIKEINAPQTNTKKNQQLLTSKRVREMGRAFVRLWNTIKILFVRGKIDPLKASLRVETHCEYLILSPYLFLFLSIWNFQDRSFSSFYQKTDSTRLHWHRTHDRDKREEMLRKQNQTEGQRWPHETPILIQTKIEMQDGGWLTTFWGISILSEVTIQISASPSER
jgi:hypothetical protein